MPTTVIVVVAVFFLAMGLYGLAAPAALIRPFGVVLSSADARTEVRAVYGGFGIAMAGLLAVAALDVGQVRQGAVLAVACALAGMAVGHLVGWVADRQIGFYPTWFYFGVEAVAAGALLGAL